MPKSTLDAYDRNILTELQKDGRVPMATLAERVGLSVSPCWRRVRRLEENGIILGYTAQLAPKMIGLNLNVFVYVALDLHKAEAFEAAIAARSEVVECYAMTGAQDYLLHIMVPDMEAFDTFLRTELVHMPGVDRVNTSFALKAIKQGPPLLPETAG